MDFTEIGAGAGGGGILAALLTWAGFKSRLDTQDKRLDAHSKQMKELLSAAQHDKECLMKLSPMEKKIDTLTDVMTQTHDAVIEMRANMHKRDTD